MKDWVLSQDGDRWFVKFDVCTLPFVVGLRLYVLGFVSFGSYFWCLLGFSW